jgi:hypothetical protein
MTKPPFPPKSKVDPYSRQAHSLNEGLAYRSAAVQLTFKLSDVSGQELGQGRFELPLSGRPAQISDDRE